MFQTTSRFTIRQARFLRAKHKSIPIIGPPSALGSLLLVGLLAVGVSNSVSAQDPIVFNNGMVPSSAEGNDATQWVQADTFQLSNTYLVTGAGIYVAGLGDFNQQWTGDLEYYFFQDSVGVPGSVIDTAYATTITASDTGVPWCCGGNIHLLEFDLVNPVALNGGTDYWLGIHLGPDFIRRFVYWLHQGVAGDAMESQFGTFDNWTSAQFKGAPRGFHLRGVPEPSSLVLTLFAILPLLRWRK